MTGDFNEPANAGQNGVGVASESPPSIHFLISTAAKLNLADFQNAVPALHDLAIANETDSMLGNLTIRLVSEPAFIKPRTWSLDSIRAGETYHLSELDVQLDGALLSRLTEAEPATLTFTLSNDEHPDKVLARHECQIELLARNQWGGIGQLPEMVAAFVQPNAPAIDRLLKGAAQALEATGKSGAINGYSEGAKRAWELTSAIWTSVQKQKLNYALPPASFEMTGQKIRSPDQVLDAGLATCLDLTLLFAACLEQAALNPILVFTRGHAFVGVWLRNEEFSTAVVDDVTALRKRTKLKELVVFETTLAAQSPAIRFSQAVAHANQQLSEGEDDTFELAVDIRRARMARIRPLALGQAPQVSVLAGDIDVSTPDVILEDAPDLPDEIVGEVPTAELDPKDRLARWQRKLLDLSLRNGMLNFKPGKRSLPLEACAPDLEDALAEGQTIRVLQDPNLMEGKDPRSQQLLEARTNEHLRTAHAAEALARGNVFVKLPQNELDTRLTELFRSTRNALQEGGANTLFLAMGFLVWTRDDRPNTRFRAPLILVPVTLGRASARSGFTLQSHEDEARFNPTLVEMLRQDVQLELGIPLNELPRDDSGIDIEGIWKRVRTAIKDIRGWEVSEDVVLSMFSFAKYLMWKDLSDRTEDLRKSPVVAHLLDTPREPYPSTSQFPDARRLDKDYTPAQVFSPLPADSSQLSAVMAAAKGKDFVLIGPPGTGKSQTIANLIAQCLAEGKHVLFVAEKIAALDVVYRRLREVGLGEFCLEIHSSKSRKLDVLSQLQRSWEAKGEIDEAGWLAKAQQLGRVREQLSTYVERLHHRHSNGWTIHRAIGCVVTGGHIPNLDFRWERPDAHDESTYAALRDVAHRLQANATAIGSDSLTTTAPLSPVHATDWSMRWQQDLITATQTLQQSSDDLAKTAKTLGNNLGIEWPELTRPVRSVLGGLSKALPQLAAQRWSFCMAADDDRINAALATGSELIAQHRTLSGRLAPAWPASLREQLSQAAELLTQYRQHHTELGTPWPPAVSDELARGVQLVEEATQRRGSLSVKYGSSINQLNVAQLQRDWAKADKSLWPMSWLGKRRVRKALEAVIEGTGEPRIADDLESLVCIRRLGEEIEQIQPGTATEGLWAGSRTRTDYAHAALKANAALQSARTQRPFTLTGMTPAFEGYCGERWANDARHLKALQTLAKKLADCAALTEASHGLWQGLDTDLERLQAAVAFEHAREAIMERGALPSEHRTVSEGRCGPVLQTQHALLQERAALEARLLALDSLRTDCPTLWKGLDSDSDAIARALRFHELLKAGMAGFGTDLSPIRAALHTALITRRDAFATSGELGMLCRQLSEQLGVFNTAIDHFSKQAAQPASVQNVFKAQSLANVWEASTRLVEAQSGLHAWCAWRHAQNEAANANLNALVNALVSGALAPADTGRAFEVSYARWWLGEAVDSDEVLKRFVSAEHEQRIDTFRALDEEFIQTTRQLIRARLCADLPSADRISRNSEWGVLRHEMAKKRAHKPLRQLLQDIPSVVLKLAPCLLMSPLSIAQYLPANSSNFDIVIFDEASQIPVWDAIGAMARAKQVVMVGDPKQLPPTNFFDRADSSELDSDDVEGDLESILDECLGASLPTLDLSWHYRSRHESLIAFSNHRYYGGGLVTFPSPVTDDRAVSFHYVNGRYEKGGARINQPEAKALVADVVARLKSPGFLASKLTIGVVTFNSEQQRLIEDLLDAERRKDPELEVFFSEVQLEPVFVKNLESVQGDERDIMYFSITYGPDLTGTLSMNFGPLNRDGGERRLNVAVTRARHELRVFSSLRGDQMDLSRTKALGVRDLKHFLEFAERGARALAEAHQGSQGDFDSPLEASVAAALHRKGWQVHTQIGASNFRIDLGVVHPDHPGSYLAGVECDGATYHRAATARDRDKLREQVLRGLGWNILRIWSTDWWVNPGGTLERIHNRLTELLKTDRTRRAEEAAQHAAKQAAADKALAEAKQTVEAALADIATHPEEAESSANASPQVNGSAATADAAETLAYARNAETAASAVSLPRDKSGHAATNRQPRFTFSDPAEAASEGQLSAERFFDADYDAVLHTMIDHVIRHEGPVLDITLARRIARAHGFQRTGSRIQDRVETLATARFTRTEEPAGTFYWPPGISPDTEVPFRWSDSDSNMRGLDEICDQELRSLARWVLVNGKRGEDTIIAMAREVGLSRLSAANRERFQTIVDNANQ